MIYIANRKTKEDLLLKKYPNAAIIDVTSKGNLPWVKFSPFFPHGGIPVPPYIISSPKYYSQSVEGIWQGLKVFEHEDIDTSKFEIRNMEGLKRTVRKFGQPIGHRNGVESKELLDYKTARKEIYLRAYAWVLDNLLQNEILLLKEKALNQNLVLLDYNTNEDIDNYNKPLSHAGLVKRYLIKKFPKLSNICFNSSNTPNVITKEKPRKLASKVKRKSIYRTEKTENKDIQKTLF